MLSYYRTGRIDFFATQGNSKAKSAYLPILRLQEWKPKLNF